MTDVRFKSLCVEASEALPLATFWGRVLGAPVTDLGDGLARIDALDGAPATTEIWVGDVAHPRRGKTRVHLDLRLPAADPGPLVALGAEVVREPGENPWWVLTDPEGNVFCAFPPEVTGDDGGTAAEDGSAPDAASAPDADAGSAPEDGGATTDRSATTDGSTTDRAAGSDGSPAPARPFELVVDCGDPWAQATWWAARTGGRACRREGRPYAWVEDLADFPWGPVVFDPVPEPKTVKNRVHWDLHLTGPDPSALVAAGARMLWEPGGEVTWWVLADPEGNEFCAFPPD